MNKQELAFGRRSYPDNVQAVWGARLIWPNDLVWNRQDIQADNDEAKDELVAWLNGPGRGDGALHEALTKLREPGTNFGWGSDSTDEAVIYEDEQGKIVGSPQGSFGYVYVCGWLHKHTD